MSRYDTVVSGGRVVLPGLAEPAEVAIGIRGGRVAAIAEDIPSSEAEEVVDAGGLHVLPGAVDSHFHIGIYRPIEEDAASETESSLVGGATSVISYFRTGSHYLNRVGPYREILPEVLGRTRGRAHTDYGFHIAPMTTAQLDEIDWMAGEAGVPSFKYYMFYKGLNLAASSTDAAAYTMSDSYDLGHLLAMMERIAEADARYGDRGRVSLSLHCESSELIKLFIERVRDLGLPPLETYSRARPPLSERLSIHEAGVLASEARVRVNLLHLSSADAVRALREVRSLYPELDIRAETTLHHLCLTYDGLEGRGLGGKVNPPIRARDDVDALWQAVRDGTLQWVASDHACCLEELKRDELWPAQPGFGGTALLYPVLLSEGYHRRGLSLQRIAHLASANPAQAYALYPVKGVIAVGSDADLALVDLEREQVVSPGLLHSAQDHTPFEGVRLRGWPRLTMLRGRVVFRDGEVVAPASGEFLARPLSGRRQAAVRA
ncbi:MAG TPA: dihydroorotase family protein [Candidatus Dormibacteraeota bacterium]|nr:dihydroorotase family protein [Candidatus Dormibacteraeota bacterium]